jgi:hypothetical protein
MSCTWSAILVITAAQCANAERRGLKFLNREVPKWTAENKCYSCHNNGDAARTLYTAIRLGRSVPAGALTDTNRWLAQSENWENNGGKGPYSDKVLARIQFSAALADAVDAKAVKDRKPLLHAASLVAADQDADGSWKVDADGSVGSPTTYGTALATLTAKRTLERADSRRFQKAITKADQWFEKLEPETVMDAATLLLALEGMRGPGIFNRRTECIKILRAGEATHGGWGPSINSPPEPFDTALVLLALSCECGDLEPDILIQRGRWFLVSTQRPDGSWPETTRPAGAVSYAQRISTTAWALNVLLRTNRSTPPIR